MKILWIDPGGTSGWATYWCQEMDGPDGKEYLEEKWTVGQLVTPNHHTKLQHLIQLQHSEMGFILGYESWHTQRNDKGEARDKVDWMAPEYIGVIKLTWQTQLAVDQSCMLVSQMPSERKFADRRKLDIFDLWSATSGLKDARSAAQHLLTYLIKTLNYPPIMKRLERGLN